MAITTVEKYTFSDFRKNQKIPFFEVKSVHLNTHFAAHRDEISEHYKIYFVEDGSGEYQVDFQTFEIEEAGLFCLSPGQVFSVKSESIKSAYQISFDKDFYCVETHGKEIACNGLIFNNVHRATGISLSAKEAAHFKSLISSMITELENQGDAHQDMLETYLRLFLIQTLRLVDVEELKKSDVSHQKDRLIQDFIALVEKHFRKEHAVSKFAEKLFVSPKSLAKRLNVLGYPTPTELIRDRIVLEAKRQLRFSHDTVKEIAYSLGFDDPAYFSRIFSKTVGSSPIEYRNNK